MDTITLYHNPRCSKSRATLELLQGYLSNQQPKLELSIVEYLKTPLTPTDLAQLRNMLGVPLRSMMRTKEAAFTEHNLDDSSNDAQLLEAMAQEPILLERPIVVFGGKAAIGRPPENVLDILPGASG